MASHTVPLAQAYQDALREVQEKLAREGESLVRRYARDTAELLALLEPGSPDCTQTRRATERALYHWRMVRRVLRYTAATPVYTEWFSWSTLPALQAHASEVTAVLHQFLELVSQARKCLNQSTS